MRLIFFLACIIVFISLYLAFAQDTLKAPYAFGKCVCLSITPIVQGKLDTTHSYVKELVLQHWPYEEQMPDARDYKDWKPYCKKRIEIEVKEPYWKKPKQYTFEKFKRLIYRK